MEKNVMLEDNLLFELETFIHITLLYMTFKLFSSNQ